jgi:hypothetical protein
MVKTVREIKLVLLISTLLLLANTPVHSQAAGSVYYILVYNPVENTGILVVNATISQSNCGYVSIPVKVFNEESSLIFLNYTVTGDLLVSAVDYNETTGDLIIFACNSGAISALFTASNVFNETGLGAYDGRVNTSQLGDLVASSTVELRIAGSYDADVIPVNVTYTVDKTADATIIVIRGFGQAYIALTSVIEVTEAPTTTTPPTAWYERPEVILGLAALIVIVVIAALVLTRRK